MPRYYVNKHAQANGDHETHEQGCSFMPAVDNRIYLGEHSTCYTAVMEARRYFARADGCYYCCRPCHTR